MFFIPERQTQQLRVINELREICWLFDVGLMRDIALRDIARVWVLLVLLELCCDCRLERERGCICCCLSVSLSTLSRLNFVNTPLWRKVTISLDLAWSSQLWDFILTLQIEFRQEFPRYRILEVLLDLEIFLQVSKDYQCFENVDQVA